MLAVSRLLHKRIGQTNDAPSALLESIRKQLTSQRRRLLAKINLILVAPKSTLPQLIETLCAFCIVTSSSSSDAIRHFHGLRLDEIRRLSSASEAVREDVLVGFDYYLGSLRTTKQLLGRQFSDAMRDLRSQPILRSPDIQSLEELDLASVQQFIPTEILSFVPWIKHPDSREIEPPSVLEQWSNIAFEEVCLGLQRTIDPLLDTSELLDLRARVLRIWLPVLSSTPMQSDSEIFEALRTIFNNRMKDLLRDEARLLPNIASEIDSVLQKDDSSMPMSSRPIWDHDLVRGPLSKGALSYKKQLVDRHLGQSKTTKTILNSLQKLAASTARSSERIRQLRTTRWIDYIEEDDDDDDRTEHIEKTLQKDDPDLYEQEHKSSLDKAAFQFQNKIEKASKCLDKTEPRKAIFLLRTIRGIHPYLATSSLQQQDLTSLFSAIPHLHQVLAANITATLLDPIKSPSSFLNKNKMKALTHLWEGDPPLPTHPSPPVLKLLQRLTSIMADQGSDLWSTDGVDAVKRAVRKGITDRKLLQIDSRDLHKGTQIKLVNGNGDRQQDEGQQIAIQIQNSFDVLYLTHALRVAHGDSDSNADTAKETEEEDTVSEPKTFTSLVQRFKEVSSTHLDATALTTLEARARGYWSRTCLLFGLLA